VPKRISCKVIKTRLYSRRSDLLIVKPWGEQSNLTPPIPADRRASYREPSITNKNFGNIGKMFNDLIRETVILDYYA